MTPVVREADFIRWLQARLPRLACQQLGLGDDAEVVRLGSGADVVVSVDMLTDGVHFRLDEIDDPRRIGHKALAVNLSDLAAMAARPVAALVAVSLPKRRDPALAQALYEGMLPLAERYGVAIAGGDTNTWDGPLVICVTVLGEVIEKGPLARSGALPGDRILVTGALGGSLLGGHLDVEPRIEEAIVLHRNYTLHAGIDVSDGLALDLSRIASASGCGAVLKQDAIPISTAAHDAARQDGASALEHALHDGEDFELIVAAAPDEAARIIAGGPLKAPVHDIGEFVAESGLWLEDGTGNRRTLDPRGYEHEL